MNGSTPSPQSQSDQRYDLCPDDETIGSVSHVHGSGADAQVIVDVGGFRGIGAKPVALQVSQLDFMRDEDGDVHATTSLKKDQAKASTFICPGDRVSPR
jgi:hypothetical protein